MDRNGCGRRDRLHDDEEGRQGRPKRRLRILAVGAALIALAFPFLLGPALQAETGKAQSADEVLKATLDNGLRVIIVRNRLAPVVTTMTNYLVGSIEAPEGFPGMAHAQEHMMFRGNPGLSSDQLTAIIAAMGGRFNADTQQTVTQYFLTVPAADLNVALHLEAIRMQGVLDTQSLWSQERGAIEQEVAQDFSSPEFIFYTKLLAAMFKGTPYAESPLGTVESFDKTTGRHAQAVLRTWYAPEQRRPRHCWRRRSRKDALGGEEVFRSDSREEDSRPNPQIHLEPVKAETIRLKTDESYGLAIIAFRMPGLRQS